MGFEYTIAARETRYNGVVFRSRLEAKWAAFFDLLQWDWEYEPIDLDGWTPDFRLFGRVLVEVKPVSDFDHDAFRKALKHPANHSPEDDEHRWGTKQHPAVLMLGSGIVLVKDEYGRQVFRLGWECEPSWPDGDSVYLMWEPSFRGWDYQSQITGYHGRRFNHQTGGRYPLEVEYLSMTLETLWREAGNRTMHRYGNRA